MTEYISRDKAREIIENQQKAVCYNGRWGRGAAIDVGKYDELEAVLDSVDAIPAAEVEPVTFTKFNHCRGKLVCGNCGWTFAWSEPKMPYRCPFCGARIDGGAENG